MGGTGTTTVSGTPSTIGGTFSKILNRTLINSGTLNIITQDNSGNLTFGTVGGEPGRLINSATGTVNVTAGGDFNGSNDPTSSINNAGTWNIAGPAGRAA
jgi:hypothetical protein